MQRSLPLILLSLCCGFGSAAVPAARAGFSDLDVVMGLLAMRQHGRVEFIEQQFLSVLKRPIESSGELRYDAPDRLEKRTLKPRTETLVLSGGILTVERAHSRRVTDLHAYPQVLPFVESIRATLAEVGRALGRGVCLGDARGGVREAFREGGPGGKSHKNRKHDADAGDGARRGRGVGVRPG